MKAVTHILKHATFLRTSNLPEAALTKVDLDYQRANIDGSIQQYLTACTSDVSVEQFTGFIMGTEIGLFILLPFVTSISYCPFSVILVLSVMIQTILFFLCLSLPSYCDSYSMTCVFVLLLNPRVALLRHLCPHHPHRRRSRPSAPGGAHNDVTRSDSRPPSIHRQFPHPITIRDSCLMAVYSQHEVADEPLPTTASLGNTHDRVVRDFLD